MILVAHSGSDSDNALDWAAAEAARRQASLTIMHVVPIPIGYRVDSGVPDEITQSVQGVLRGAEDRAKAAGVKQVESVTGYSSVAGALVEMSREADLIVVGNRGHGEASAALLGSVAYTVTSHAACPVVVVRGDGRRGINEGNPIVVGVDGSRPSVRATHFAAELAQDTGADLEIIGVWDVPSFGKFARRVGFDVQHDADEARVRESVDQALEDLTARYPQVAITGAVRQGSPVFELLQAGEDAGLIVVGSRGRGGFAGLLLGSVSHRVIHDASCPVAIVR